MPKKLLVADDSLTIQKVIRLALAGAGSSHGEAYEIQTVSDGNDAVQQISLFRPDVVLIDVSLPSKSAFEVKRATNLHRDLDHVRFVLMSSAFEKVDEAQVKEVVFHARLTKPFDPAHLREILSQVLSSAPKAPAPRREATMIFSPPSEEGPGIEIPRNMPPLPPESTGSLSAPPRLPPSLPDFPPPLPLSEDLSLPPSFEPGDADSDIRHLTKSTIEMSGLVEDNDPSVPAFDPPPMRSAPPAPPELPESDEENDIDFQWSVQENSLKPPSMIDAGNTTFPGAPPRDPNMDRSGFIRRPTAEELRSEPPAPSSIDLPIFPPPPPDVSFEEDQGIEEAPRFTPPPRPNAVPPIDLSQLQKKLEEMVKQEVEKALRTLTQQTLPSVTERVIKEEIHKLLSESP